MQFLYSGGILYQSQPEKVLEVNSQLLYPSLTLRCFNISVLMDGNIKPIFVFKLLDCAAKLQLPSLKQTCEFETTRHITSYNAVDVYTCAKVSICFTEVLSFLCNELHCAMTYSFILS